MGAVQYGRAWRVGEESEEREVDTGAGRWKSGRVEQKGKSGRWSRYDGDGDMQCG